MKRARSAVLAAILAACLGKVCLADEVLYMDASQPLGVRVDDLLNQMTLEEKISLLHGDSKFTTAEILRLGIPRRWMSDGPQGVREDVGPDTWTAAGKTDDFSTYMPGNIGLAASFNIEMAKAYGNVIGQEALKRGKHIMLGPGLNIMRTPLNGRNFEYLGEDSFLTGQMGANYVMGVQGNHVASCTKHFAMNNQETNRNSVDVEVDDRALHEIYLPAFKNVVQEGHVLCVMTAYNKFRGSFCSENDLLVNQILKGGWGFTGLVMSDWGGVHSTVNATMHGLDLEMGTNGNYDDFYFANPLIEAVNKGDVPISVINDHARRNLRVMIASGVLDGLPEGSINTAAHQETARKVAEEGIVLLKNEGAALPLDLGKVKSIAVIGENAVTKFAPGGASAGIKAFYEVTALEGILKRAGGNVPVTYARGYVVEDNTLRRRGAATEASATQSAGAKLLEDAVAVAKNADVVIIVAGLNHHLDSEGVDRKDISMPAGQNELIEKVMAVNPRTVLVLNGGGAIEMPWLSSVPAVVYSWYGGTEGGNALARVLFGDVNPSGKLPCTFPKVLADSPAHAMGNYPGKDGVEKYEEGILVGYRWFDAKGIEPLFPFGFGLSYTTFGYSDLKLKAPAAADAKEVLVNVEATVANTGAREGKEVVEVYVAPRHASVMRPPQELKGFGKVNVAVGKTGTVSIPLNMSSFAYYDPARKGWVAEAGEYEIRVGSSSRDIRLTGTYTLPETLFQKEGS